MNQPSTERTPIHALFVRIFHWLNAIGIVLMIMSGWRIYNASPLFDFTFPASITLGGWLGGALQWHFAAMWLLVVNFSVYLIVGLFTGHFRRRFFPLTPKTLAMDFTAALKRKLPHSATTYNAVQKASYIGVLLAILITILSGTVVWKPVQAQALGALIGGYEGARLIHFLGMTAISAFIIMHLALVLIVPNTLLPMIRGWAGIKPSQHNENQEEAHNG
jgi:thiosulfate reductase cytochrome b subunit